MSRIVVGLSGGVDSAVAAGLLLEQGHEVIGLFMKNWEEDDTAHYCSAAQDIEDVRSVCQQLQIRLHTVNFAAEYWEEVFETFLAEHREGRTPNPDVLCNRYIKFAQCRGYAIEQLGADFLATGHYAQVRKGEGAQMELHRGIDESGYRKVDVRSIARQWDLPVAEKRDSTGICFIGKRPFRNFLSRFIASDPGEIVTEEGEVVGKHMGLMYYTIGQRAGLGIGGLPGKGEEPWYVSNKDVTTRRLEVVQGAAHPKLYAHALYTSEMEWIGSQPALPFRCTAKVRYQQPDQPVTITAHAEGLYITFRDPVRAPTPGQVVVLYDGTRCLGGATIDRIDPIVAKRAL